MNRSASSTLPVPMSSVMTGKHHYGHHSDPFANNNDTTSTTNGASVDRRVDGNDDYVMSNLGRSLGDFLRDEQADGHLTAHSLPHPGAPSLSYKRSLLSDVPPMSLPDCADEDPYDDVPYVQPYGSLRSSDVARSYGAGSVPVQRPPQRLGNEDEDSNDDSPPYHLYQNNTLSSRSNNAFSNNYSGSRSLYASSLRPTSYHYNGSDFGRRRENHEGRQLSTSLTAIDLLKTTRSNNGRRKSLHDGKNPTFLVGGGNPTIGRGGGGGIRDHLAAAEGWEPEEPENPEPLSIRDGEPETFETFDMD